MNPSPQLALDLLQPLQPTLDNYVAGRNGEALAAVRALADGRGERFVYLFGEAGSGRTHLLRAVAATAPSRWLDATGAPVAFDASVRLYLADDVERYDAARQQQLFVLQNEVRASRDAVLLAAGAVAPALLPVRDDVRTRLAWGLAYPLHLLDDAAKAAALRTHAVSRGIALPDDAIAWLLTHLPRDMRTLVAVVDALDAHALAAKRAITLSLVRQWVQHDPRQSALPLADEAAGARRGTTDA